MQREALEQVKDYSKKHARVVAKAWLDPAFKKRLIANPTEVLKSEGIDVPAGVEIRVLEHAANVRYFELPAKPASLEGRLTEEQLTLVDAGLIMYTCSSSQCTFESHWV
jgi:hypothetical protein